MKKFEFSLERIRNYKETVLEKEKLTLSRMRQAKNRLDERILKTEQNCIQVSNELNVKTKEGISVNELKSYHFQLDNLRVLQKGLYREQRRMEDEIEHQLVIVLHATGELSGFDKLKDKKLQEYKDYVLKADADAISEFLSTQIASADAENENDI